MPKITIKNYKEVLLPELFSHITHSYDELKLVWGSFNGLTDFATEEWLGEVAKQLSKMAEDGLSSPRIVIEAWVSILSFIRFHENHKDEQNYYSRTIAKNLSGIITQMVDEVYECFVSDEVEKDFASLVYIYTGKEWFPDGKTQEECGA